MTRHRTNLLLAAALPLALLAGCKQDAAPSDTASSMQKAVETAAEDAEKADALPAGDAPLKPGQTVQGTIEADVGKGMQSFRSLSTKVADDIGEQLDAKLDTRKGNQAIEDANRTLEATGTGMRIDAGDVREIVGDMAGKTFHESSVMHVGIIQALQVTLSTTAGDGSKLELGLTFNDKSLALDGASLMYRPNAAAMFDTYDSKDVQVTIDKFERNPDGSYAISGSFSAKDLQASPLAKKLDSATLAAASGRFVFAALPAKDMPKFGR